MGLDAGGPQLGDRMLGGFGLVLARRADIGHQRHVYVADVVVADIEPELTYGFQEREDLNVTDRAPYLGDKHVDLVPSQGADPTLDLVGDVGDHLHRAPQVLAVAFGGNDRRVDGPGGGVGVPGQVLVNESLVVAEVKVGLAAVVGDEHLAVLKGVHGPRVDVDVGVELLDDDPKPPLLEEATQGGRRQSLAQGTGDAARNENVFRHGIPTYRLQTRWWRVVVFAARERRPNGPRGRIWP